MGTFLIACTVIFVESQRNPFECDFKVHGSTPQKIIIIIIIYSTMHLLLIFIDEAVEIQENLLDPLKSHLKPDDRSLQIFARVVGNHWPHLASQLSLSTRDIMEELKRRGRSSPADQALYMLQKWKSREEATYGLLCERLRTVFVML